MITSSLAQRMDTIKPSVTLEITAKAAALKNQGLSVLNLGAGEPDFDTPDHIKAAAVKAMEKGYTKYTAVDGIPPLKAAIAAKMLADTQLTYDPSEIVVGVGAKQVIFNAMMATLNPGDEVIIPAPYWVSYPEMVAFAGGVSTLVPCGPELGFKITPQLLADAITPRTRWLILNSPSNPTGAVYSREDLQALGTVLLQHPHVQILCDDIYEYLVFEKTVFTTLPQVVPALKERCLVVNGVSKSYAMTGWRIGWGCGPKWLISAIKNIQSQSTSNACSIAQHAVVEALTQPRDFLPTWVASFQSRRDYVVKALNDAEGLVAFKPEGAFYVYVGCEQLMGRTTPGGAKLSNDQDMANYLLTDHLVAVVPGSAFGLSPYFRISYATDLATLTTACTRIQQACAQLK